MFGKSLSSETKALINKALSGKKNPMYGRIGENHHMIGKTGDKNPMFGKSHTPGTKALMNKAQGITIYLYYLGGSLLNTFSSARKAAEHFDVSKNTILKYAKIHQKFKEN